MMLSRLKTSHARALEQAHSTKSRASTSSAEDHSGHHGAKAPSIFTAVPAAFINFLLMFGLCCAFSMIMFEDEWNQQHRGMAVKMNLASAFFVGGLFSVLSGIPVAIGGTDLNPVVFLGMFVQTIAESLAKKHDLVYPDGRRLLGQLDAGAVVCDPVEFLRRLGGSSDAEFCTGAHYAAHELGCDKYHSELAATTIFSVAFSSLIIGILFFILGRFKLSKMVTYIPTNIVEAFLSCVGYKVFKYALKFSKYEPRQFLPAACVGVPMYFAKTLHVGNPAIVIPTMLLIPLGIFYAIVFGSGGDLESARESNFMFPVIENDDFWSVWTSTLGDASSIDFSAWSSTLSSLPVMVIVVCMDCMLKLSATENKIPVHPDMDREMMLFGSGNILTTLTGSCVGYMQLKFNVINYGVMGNATDRRGSALYALFCGFFWFWSTDVFNYLPRFFLSALLFFAGAGFVAENLWGSRRYLSIMDWMQIIIILGVFVFTDSILNAVYVGGMLCGLTFIYRYARISPIHGRLMRGGEVRSNIRRPPDLEVAIANVSNEWLLVLQLKGYLFFASAHDLTRWLMDTVQTQTKTVPAHRRVRWVILDCSLLDGMDSSASKAFTKFAKVAKGCEVTILWSGVTQAMVSELTDRGTIDNPEDCFASLNEAKTYTDHLVIEYIGHQQARWTTAHPWFRLSFDFALVQAAMDPFKGILSSDVARAGCPWKYCRRMNVTKFSTILWKPGEFCRQLFLVYTGRVGLFTSLPEEDKTGGDDPPKWDTPICIYTHGCFANSEALLHRSAKEYAVALDCGELLYWSEEDWGKMKRERPQMASAIMEATLRQEKNHVAAPTGVGRKVASGTKNDVVTPQECRQANKEAIQQWTHDMEVAKELDGQGFYIPIDANESAKLPDLPQDVLRDLDVAFHTFATKPEAGSSIPAALLPRACAYAGLFEILPGRLTDNVEDYSREQFIAIAHSALMLSLSGSIDMRLREMFIEYADEQSEIDRSQLVTLFRDNFYRAIDVFEVNAICDLFGNRMEDKIDQTTFLAIMSRFAAKQEFEWRLLCGVQELMGGNAATTAGLADVDLMTALTAEHLCSCRDCDISTAEAMDMIWFANCCSGSANTEAGEPETFDIRLLPAIFVDTGSRLFALPPEPMKPGLESSSSLPPAVTHRQTSAGVVDYRDLAKHRHSQLSRDITLFEFEATRSAQMKPEKTVVFEDSEMSPPTTFKQRVYQLVDEPGSSPAANIIAVVMGLMIMLSVFTLILEPLVNPKQDDEERTIWWYFECFFTIIFTIELVVRFAVADAMGTMTRWDFIRRPMNICDFVAVTPFYLDLIMSAGAPEFRLFRSVRLLRLSRLARLGRLMHHHAAVAPIAVILMVIWGIYIRYGGNEKK